jgi:hypothetical protein
VLYRYLLKSSGGNMRNKFMMGLFCVATFFTCMHSRLEANSNNNNLIVITIASGATNVLAVSSHTFSTNRDIDISAEGDTETQFVGVCEITATKASTSNQKLTIAAQRTHGSFTSADWAAIQAGAVAGDLTEATNVSGNALAIRIQTDVASSSTTEFTAQSPADINHTSGSADLTTATASTYASQTMTLSFYLRDHASNSMVDGTYHLHLLLAFGN